VGLVQRVIEASGIPTVGVSIAKEISLKVKPPRTLFLKYPFGHPFGEVEQPAQHLQVFKDALALFHSVEIPGTIIDSPYQWRRSKFL